MPLYEYECDACRGRFERIQKFSDPPVECCPTCGGGVRKLPSSPAIQFKGTGWYVTDYAKKPRPGQGADDREAGDGAKGGDTKGGDAKGGDAKGGDTKASSSDSSAADPPRSSGAAAPSRSSAKTSSSDVSR